MIEKVPEYWKFIVALVTPIVATIASVADDGVSAEEWITIGASILVALGVLVVKNRQPTVTQPIAPTPPL